MTWLAVKLPNPRLLSRASVASCSPNSSALAECPRTGANKPIGKANPSSKRANRE